MVFDKRIYHRLVLEVTIPTLAERLVDLPEIVDGIRHSTPDLEHVQVRPCAVEAIARLPLNGNVRDVVNVLVTAAYQGACTSTGVIDRDHIERAAGRQRRQRARPLAPASTAPSEPLSMAEPASLPKPARGDFRSDDVRRRIKDAFARLDGCQAATARALGVPRSTLRYQLRELRLLGPRPGQGPSSVAAA